MPRGYDQILYILPFDHRSSFQAKLFGWKSRLSKAQIAPISSAKQVIYDGFKSMVEAVGELQGAGVQPDVCKAEGLDRCEDCAVVEAAARAGGRDRVGCIVLGRGGDERRVRKWLTIAAAVPGFIFGFAVGRASLWDPLVGWKNKTITREQAVIEIALRYREFVRLFEAAVAVPAGVR
jgi:5-dehydro-2-deoxygluconokinase